MTTNIKVLQNGTIQIDYDNLRLYNSHYKGIINTECMQYNKDNDTFLMCSIHDEKFKPLFIALHNWKIENVLR